MANEINSVGVKLSYNATDTGTGTEVKNLLSTPDLGEGVPSKIEVTNLSDSSQRFIDGIREVADSLEFTCIYEKGATGNFATLSALKTEQFWTVEYPDGMKIKFKGTCTCTMSGAEVNGALQFVLGVTPTSAITITAPTT